MSHRSVENGSIGRFFTAREPVRMDLALHGARFIITEFVLATVIALALAVSELVLFTFRDHSISQLEGGIFFLSCTLNTFTFLVLAIQLVRRHDGTSRVDYSHGLALLRTLAAVIFLLVPLLFPFLAIVQGRGQRAAGAAQSDRA